MRIFIGNDSRHPEATKVCRKSILDNSSIKIASLVKKMLIDQGIYKRKDVPNESTEFSFTRFYVPLVNNWKGVAIFCDNDFVWKSNPKELLQYLGDKPLAVVKHDLEEVKDSKMDGIKNKWYPKKCWSSLMVFNCAKLRNILTQEYLNNATPQELHQFEWLDEAQIAEIPVEYNHLVGYYKPHDNIKAIHYTNGGPWFDEYKDGELSEEWWKVYKSL